MRNRRNERERLYKIYFVCEQCGKRQEKDEKMSNENWTIYNNHAKCTCGGGLKMKIEWGD